MEDGLSDALAFSEEECMIRDMVADFAKNEIAPIAIEIDREERFPRELFARMGELGILGTPFPEEIGGAGSNWVSLCLAIEEVAKVCGSTGLGLAAAVSLGIEPLAHFGSEEQKERYLPDLMAGKTLAAFGLTEANAGSDAGGSMETRAVLEGDTWVINGNKCWITNGTSAEVIVITARTDPQQGNRGISNFLLTNKTPGFEARKMTQKLGMRGSDTAEMTFEDVRVPRENMVGEEGKGFTNFLKILDGGRIIIGTLALGIAGGAFAKALAYAKERKQFGRPISSFQAIQFKLSDMACKIHGAKLMCYHAARLKDAGRPYSQEAAMAKLFASEMSYEVTKEAIQILGGVGYCREYEVERMFRDTKLCEIGEGTSEIQRMVIARSLLRG
ncbi:acyl-CoA dehydrogenase family protein [Planctomycetota bacterium]